MAKKTLIVSLTGGLGNQLFQLAAALKISNGEKIQLTAAYGNPRPFNSNNADLFTLSLPNSVRIIKRKPAAFLIKKCVGYNLRMGTNPRNYEKYKFVKWFIKFTTNLLLFIDLYQYSTLVAGRGVGYCNITLGKKNSFLVGYFQSYKWALDANVKKELMKIKPLDNNKLLESLILKAKIEKPLFVHVRLSDYKNEDRIGVLSKEYYFNSVRKQMEYGSYSKIWLFSDEAGIARNYIPEEFKKVLTIVPDISGSPAATLELLRHGSGYVIANSSFSWWGAMLAHKEGVRVIAPYPWFKKMESPIDLIPPNWETLNPW